MIGPKVRVVKGDIFDQPVDAIVNPANREMAHGGGLAALIAKRAGPLVVEESKALAPIKTGQSIITTPGTLFQFKAIVHTVGPVWQGGDYDEAVYLAEAYRSAIYLAEQHDMRSMAFPAVSCGIYGYPVESAAITAVRAVREAQANAKVKVIFAVTTEEHLRAFRGATVQ